MVSAALNWEGTDTQLVGQVLHSQQYNFVTQPGAYSRRGRGGNYSTYDSELPMSRSV